MQKFRIKSLNDNKLFNMDRRVFEGDILVERSFELVGMGETGRCGAGFVMTNPVSAS